MRRRCLFPRLVSALCEAQSRRPGGPEKQRCLPWTGKASVTRSSRSDRHSVVPPMSCNDVKICKSTWNPHFPLSEKECTKIRESRDTQEKTAKNENLIALRAFSLFSVYPLWAVDIDPLQDPHLVTDSGLRGASRRGRKDRGGDGGDRRFRLQSRAASAGARVEAVTRFRVFRENTASTVETT